MKGRGGGEDRSTAVITTVKLAGLCLPRHGEGGGGGGEGSRKSDRHRIGGHPVFQGLQRLAISIAGNRKNWPFSDIEPQEDAVQQLIFATPFSWHPTRKARFDDQALEPDALGGICSLRDATGSGWVKQRGHQHEQASHTQCLHKDKAQSLQDCAHGSICESNNINVRSDAKASYGGTIGKVASASVHAKALLKDLSPFERAQIGASAGGIAGAITYVCLHPLDTVKTKLQTRGASQLYSGPLDVIVKTFKSQGLLGFYSGVSAVLVGSMFSSAVYFGTCELGKALFSQLPNLPPIVIPPLAGAMGNLISSAILVPKEVITQRMQVGANGRSWQVFLRIVEKEGLKGLYTGYSAALVRNLPASVLSFSSFEYLKAAWMKKGGKNRLEPWQSVTSGALAGAISAAITTPLDVVKTRLMTQARSLYVGSASLADAELQAKITASTYKGITSTLKMIWVEEGWMGLTKGVLPRILYSACFSALGYFAFESARLTLVKHHVAKKKLLSSNQVIATSNILQ